jgi:hypothetical protein
MKGVSFTITSTKLLRGVDVVDEADLIFISSDP